MLGNSDIQIKTAYEEEGMSPEEISQDMGYEVVAVKAKLMQVSSKYRSACGKEPEEESELNFSDEQLKIVTQEMFDLAMHTEDEHLKYKCLTYIRDDKKGRKDVVKATQQVPINLLQFNQFLNSSKNMAQQAIQNAIDVTSSVDKK